MYEAKVIADSISNGNRLTTMQLTHPRIVHAEFMTHGMFARNASSSRAIPFSTMTKRVIEDPYIPRTFSKNQKGMQPAEPLIGEEYERAKELWLEARNRALGYATVLADHLNVHKETVNRLLEPWGWITVCVTGTWDAWSNYFSLRCHPMAAEAIRDQAYMAQKAYFTSTPKELSSGDWHLPYLTREDIFKLARERVDWTIRQVHISSGRCARTSYLTQEGVRDFDEDVKLHDRLAGSRPIHASPFEHVCRAMGDKNRYNKYIGWKSYRHTLPGEYVTDFKPNHPDLVGQGN